MPSATPTTTPLADMAQTFAFHSPALKKLVADFDQDDWLYRPSPTRSHAYWILGHLTTYRLVMANAVGTSRNPTRLVEQFGKGTEPTADLVIPLDELWAQFDEAGDAFAANLPLLTDEQLTADCGRTFPNGSNTVGGQLHFMNFHECFHMGQISMIAYARGKDTLV